MTELTLLQYLVQGGFAALFIWLLIDTRKEARLREAESKGREERLMKVIDAFKDEFVKVTVTLAKIEERLNSFTEKRE